MSRTAPGLRDRRILVAEDEYTIAVELAAALGEAGAEVVGPVSRVGEALDLVRSGGRLDSAVLDVNLMGEMIWPVAEALGERGVPVVLASGYDADAIPAAYGALPCCRKPADARTVIRALMRGLARR